MPEPSTEQRLDQIKGVSNARAYVEERLASFLEGFEDRLAASLQKALDVVTGDFSNRLRQLEEDQARILRHLGLDRGERPSTRDGNTL